MKLDYPRIKKLLHIGIFTIDLLIFLIVLFSTNSSSDKYKEYTDSSKFFLNIYIIIIYSVLILITIIPKLLYYKIKNYISFIFSDKGKAITSAAIALIYWFAKNGPQFTLGVLLTITTIILLVFEFLFYFTKVETFLINKGIEFENKNKSTFDFSDLEKGPPNDITPKINSEQYNKSSGNQNNENKNGNEDDNKGNNNTGGDENNDSNNNPVEQRDVEISSGFDNNSGANPQGLIF